MSQELERIVANLHAEVARRKRQASWDLGLTIGGTLVAIAALLVALGAHP